MRRHVTHIVVDYGEHHATCTTCGWAGPFRVGDSWTEPGRRDARQHMAESAPTTDKETNR